MKKLYIVLMTFALSIGISGCSTVEGLGKDIEKGGEAIEKAAQKHQ
ncbi:entericidin A/B family lipoprotein [Neptunomonas sp.]